MMALSFGELAHHCHVTIISQQACIGIMWGWGKTKFMYTFSSEKKNNFGGSKMSVERASS